MFEKSEKNTRKKLKLPSKKNMNLYQKVVTDNSMVRVIPTLLLITVLVFLIWRVGVIERLNAVSRIRSDCAVLERQMREYGEKLDDYDDVTVEYRRYTKHYQTDDESVLVPRKDIIALLKNEVAPIGDIQSISVQENSVTINVVVISFDDVAVIRENLEGTGSVTSVMVYNADKSNKDDGNVSCAITFNVIRLQEEG